MQLPHEHIQRRINNTTVFSLNNSDLKVLPLAISLSSVVLVRTKLLVLALVLVLVLRFTQGSQGWLKALPVWSAYAGTLN